MHLRRSKHKLTSEAKALDATSNHHQYEGQAVDALVQV